MWRVWVDTGGTFTDCLALDPEGRLHRAKVLSSSALRGRVEAALSDHELRYGARWSLPDGFAAGAALHWLERDGAADEITVCRGSERLLRSATVLPSDLSPGEPFEIRFEEEAPILAARLVTATAASSALPELAMRLATTRGTNALLERRGARCVLLVTEGFGDLLRIGNQQRPDLFALDPRRSPPLYEEVIEVPERLDAAGDVIRELDLEALAPRLHGLVGSGIESAAVALLHSYRNPAHEQRLAAELEHCGVELVSASAALAPTIKIVPRAATAVVDAYLAPIIGRYLQRVGSALGGGRLHVMTSAGGLTSAERYRASDSLLSGPAGGVVGAARSGRRCGFERLIAFDMGGTSTDVSRFDGDFEYVFEHRVGDASVAAPALAIETVAAGGGSICHREGRQLKVGPHSAGAHPGPACYGAGGPLTLTDVNLLLGRLDPRRFGIPIQPRAAERAAAELLEDLHAPAEESTREALLEGFASIANERMAEAIRRVSIRRGYDPAEYTLVAFGGAGGQHACAVAGLLDMATVLAPSEAGLLSAAGLGTAVIERFAGRQVLAELGEFTAELEGSLRELARRAFEQVAEEGVDSADVVTRRRLVFLRFAGQETVLEIEVDERGEVDGTSLRQAFLDRYQALYGYRPPSRPIEVDSLRVVASSRPDRHDASFGDVPSREASPADQRRAFFDGSWHRVPLFHGPELEPGDRLAGPALVLDDYATLVVDAGWRARVTAAGVLLDRDLTA
ncbi:MAG: hydantoinase/oxoprolinase family protein [bacterium]|nr:hydantoinase/oxoprolinase family protein [bacterium]